MKIERKFTRSGQDAYAELDFVSTASEIRNPDGSVVFRRMVDLRGGEQSILDAGLQHEGRVRCVECRETVELTWEDAMIVCTFCDWECSSVAYRRTIKYKKLK